MTRNSVSSAAIKDHTGVAPRNDNLIVHVLQNYGK
jgi:hypothetical protein